MNELPTAALEWSRVALINCKENNIFFYQKAIHEMADSIEDEASLHRLYNLTSYLYIK